MKINKSPLHEYHVANGATMKIFGNWEMPATYNSKWEEEYQAVRERIGLFDMSCITKIKVTGDSALEFLEEVCTGNISSLSESKMLNTLLCREDGTIIAIIWLLKEDDNFIIHTDAEKRQEIWQWLNQQAKNFPAETVKLQDLSESLACISVIGPQAIEIPKILISEDIIGLPYAGFEPGNIEDIDCLVCRYGYTGEYEYRFIFEPKYTEKIWHKIREVGKEYNISLCGLNILDILMMEMKSINQNKDLTSTTTPLQAGLHWMIYFRKENFIGKEAIFKEKQTGIPLKLMVITLESGGTIKENSQVFLENQQIGFIIHYGYSPTLKKDIGLAYLDNKYAWVGLEFEAECSDGSRRKINTVSAPLFITKTVIAAQEG
jgi:aminomethyltransferase